MAGAEAFLGARAPAVDEDAAVEVAQHGPQRRGPQLAPGQAPLRRAQEGQAEGHLVLLHRRRVAQLAMPEPGPEPGSGLHVAGDGPAHRADAAQAEGQPGESVEPPMASGRGSDLILGLSLDLVDAAGQVGKALVHGRSSSLERPTRAAFGPGLDQEEPTAGGVPGQRLPESVRKSL